MQLSLELLLEAFLEVLELLSLRRHKARAEAAAGPEAASLEARGDGGRARGLEARAEVKAGHPLLHCTGATSEQRLHHVPNSNPRL